MNDCKKDDNDRIALAIKEMEEEGVLFKPDGKPNVPELMKRAEISRQRARRIAANGFKLLPHGNAGMVHIIALSKEEVRELDSMLTKGVTNSNVILRVIRGKFGYKGSKSSVDRMKKKLHRGRSLQSKGPGSRDMRRDRVRCTRWTGGSST